MRIKKWVGDLFGFSQKEVNGFVILLPLMVLVIVSEPLYRKWVSLREDDFTADERRLDSLVALWHNVEPIDSGRFRAKHSDRLHQKFFHFNPNTIDESALSKLGFPKSLSTRIASYRQKGGVFRVKSDLLKIYGLDSTFYKQLYTYIQLPQRIEVRPSGPKPGKVALWFDLNTADTAQLKMVNGIGQVLAMRILKFRDRLGGFVGAGQLVEVYGMDSVVVNRLRRVSFVDENFIPRKIDVNTASESEFSAHPYIGRKLARAIVAYRFQHGNFEKVEDIRNIKLVEAAEADKIIPYLKVHD